jgi:1,4-dihydroxy-2-naphthoate octaprenyltransferase
MNFKKIIRHHDWWTSKIAPILAIGYATILINDANLFKSAIWILFLLLSLVTGATYVSVINDLTDAADDVKAGKNNNMPLHAKKLRWLMLIVCVLLGGVFMYFFYPDTFSFVLYIMSWVVFSLYSFPPVRLKIRGLWGVVADASGAHLFPTCLVVTSMSYFLQCKISLVWMIAVAVWALALGLRGILWHQLRDRDTDILVGINTYASKIAPQQLKHKEKILISFEILAFAIILIVINAMIVILFFCLYLIFIVVRYKLFNTRLTILESPGDGNYRLVMTEYYQIFFPVSLLLKFSFYQPKAWIILVIHILLFLSYLLENFRPFLSFKSYQKYVKIILVKKWLH